MFTGIVQAIGQVVALDRRGDLTLTIAASMPMEDLPLGASVACNGVCLTVVAVDVDGEAAKNEATLRHGDLQAFKVQASAQTLACTTLSRWEVGTRVNLERALRVGDELSGHLVFGHVDGQATLTARTPEGDSLRLTFEAPEPIAPLIAPKGSVALDGVSLTVNEVQGLKFCVNVIAHTQNMTTLDERQIGDLLNIEGDMLARYVARQMQFALPSSQPGA